MNPHPKTMPLGILLHRSARLAERAFDRSLGGGGSRWQILRALAAGQAETQAALAKAVGLRGATLVHHLDALETEGLVARRRSAENRRLQTVALTQKGRARFDAMLQLVLGFDAKLRAVIGSAEEERFRAALVRIMDAFAPED
jgi:MarR family transcriptional regulator, transcriptional regulator for hemolysin